MANPNPSPSTRWKKGHVHTEGKVRTPTDLVREYGKKRLFKGAQSTQAQAVVETAFERAKKGDSKVIPYLLDRLFGKVTQPIEITGMEQLGERISKARSRLAAPPAEPKPETPPEPQPEAQEPTIQ